MAVHISRVAARLVSDENVWEISAICRKTRTTPPRGGWNSFGVFYFVQYFPGNPGKALCCGRARQMRAIFDRPRCGLKAIVNIFRMEQRTLADIVPYLCVAGRNARENSNSKWRIALPVVGHNRELPLGKVVISRWYVCARSTQSVRVVFLASFRPGLCSSLPQMFDV